MGVPYPVARKAHLRAQGEQTRSRTEVYWVDRFVTLSLSYCWWRLADP